MAESISDATHSTGGSLKSKFSDMSRTKKILCICLGILFLIALILVCAFIIKSYVAAPASSTAPSSGGDQGSMLRSSSTLTPISVKAAPSSSKSDKSDDSDDGSKKKEKSQKKKRRDKQAHHHRPSSADPEGAKLLGINDIHLTTIESSLGEKQTAI